MTFCMRDFRGSSEKPSLSGGSGPSSRTKYNIIYPSLQWGDDTAVINHVKGRKHCKSTENGRAVPAQIARFGDFRSSPQNDSEPSPVLYRRGVRGPLLGHIVPPCDLIGSFHNAVLSPWMEIHSRPQSTDRILFSSQEKVPHALVSRVISTYPALFLCWFDVIECGTHRDTLIPPFS